MNYAKGHGTFAGAPFVNHQSLSEKGFINEELEKLDKAVMSAFDIDFVMNHYTLGEECLKRLGFTPEEYHNPKFNLLLSLGFKREEIAAANDYVCGTMMIEGAPDLKDEHLSIFDCANKCGKDGERFIHAHGHIKMMGAVQPFISGAISKTINLPNEATVDEIKDCYKLSWELALKANALYRDGSKLSQPLSNKSDKDEDDDNEATGEATVEKVITKETFITDPAKMSTDDLLLELEKRMTESKDTKLKRRLSTIVERKTLPAKRRGYTIKSKIGGQAVFLRTGEYNDGTLGEIFIDMSKEGATIRSLLNCFAISVSIGLQYGVPLEEFVDKFIFTRFEPAGRVEHPNIKNATSIVDYIFRALGHEYLGREDLVHVLDVPKSGETSWDEPVLDTDATKVSMTALSARAAVKQSRETTTKAAVMQTAGKERSEKELMGTSADAPMCKQCGNITMRNGTCYMCPNCGTTTGCS